MKLVRPFTSFPEVNRPEFNEAFTPFVCMDKIFSVAEVSKIKTIYESGKPGESQIVRDGNAAPEPDLRKSKEVRIDVESNEWIYDKLTMVAMMANSAKYKFDISGFQRNLKIVNYEVGDFFDWHMDFGPNKVSNRKLTMSIQLSDANEYQGGELQFLSNNIPFDAPKSVGTIIIYPSFILHRVLPITSGCRKAIVGHIAGPPYR